MYTQVPDFPYHKIGQIIREIWEIFPEDIVLDFLVVCILLNLKEGQKAGINLIKRSFEPDKIEVKNNRLEILKGDTYIILDLFADSEDIIEGSILTTISFSTDNQALFDIIESMLRYGLS